MNNLDEVKSLNVDMIEEARELAKEGSKNAIQAKMSDVREELEAATKRFAELTEETRDTTWLKRTYMGIGGAALLGLVLVAGAYAMTSRHLSVTQKRAEVAHLDKSISDNWIVIEKQKLENQELHDNVAKIKQEMRVITRFKASS